MRPFACFFAFAWLISTCVWGQSAEGTTYDAPDGTLVAPPTVKRPSAKSNPTIKGTPNGEPQVKVEPPGKKEPPPLVVKATSDADLHAVWTRWSAANASKDTKAEQKARLDLLAMRETIGSPNMELWAIGLLRAAQAWEEAGDSGAAVEIALTASELAPDLPATWFLLARLYFVADPSGLGRYVGALYKGVAAQLHDPRYLRPMIADLVSVMLIAFILTSVAVILVLFLRRGYYAIYDFRFVLPGSVARWQTTSLALLLLAIPVVFRWGVVPSLLAFFAAVTLYLSWSERLVATTLIGLLGLVPVLGGMVVEHTVFATTPAEAVYRIERGGPGIEPLVHQYEQLAIEDKVGFAERFALGHFHLNRGHLDQALVHLQRALAMRPDDVPSRVALAKTFFLQGDLENSRSLLEDVKRTAPSATVLLNLGRVYQRRVQIYGDASAADLDKANSNFFEARQLESDLPPLSTMKDPKENLQLRTFGLAKADLLMLAKANDTGRRVRNQLSRVLVGDVPPAVAPAYPFVLAVLLCLLGFWAKALQVSKPCTRCGRAVSRRGDPELPSDSELCAQCVNVFTKKAAVALSVKVRKQLDVARYEGRMAQVSTMLGVLWSGMGHVFSGSPVRGVLYGYLFVLAITGAVLGEKVVRPPFEGIPLVVRVLPLVILFLAVYPFSLLELRRKPS